MYFLLFNFGKIYFMKKVWIDLAVLVVLFGIAFIYLNERNRSLSPMGEAKFSNENVTATILYSRPSVRGRLIFGTKEQEALVPFGEYWRFGANESTEIEINAAFKVGATELEAGKYKIYAIPGPETFEVRFSKDLGKWGYSEPDYALDVAKINAETATLPESVEQFTINMEESANGLNIYSDFDKTRIIIQ